MIRKATVLKARRMPILFGFFFAILLICQGAPASAASGQSTKKEPLSEAARQWLEEVVPYIITPAEKEIFLNLPTEVERGKFIENFWKKRDPNPATPENEFKIAYYRRIAFANKFFGFSGIPGWKTDRGRIFILLGPPNEIQNDYLASRDSLAQPGAIKETWTYWDLPNPNLPYSLEFTFVDRYGTGNYELETGRGYRDDGSFALDLDSVHQYFNQMEILAEAMRNPFEKAEKLREVITTQVNYDLVPFNCDLYSRKATADKSQTIISLTIPVKALEVRESQGKTEYSLTLMLSLSNELGQSLLEKTQEIDFSRKAGQPSGLSLSEYFLPLSLVTAPGKYGFHLLLLDNNSGKIGTLHKQIEVPDFARKGLALSDIILASSGPAPAENQKPALLHPKRDFRSDETMELEFEVYNVSLDPETKKGQISVKLFFYKDKEIITSPPALKKEVLGTADCRVQTSLVPRNFQPGNYLLRVEVIDEVASITCSGERSFRIIQ